MTSLLALRIIRWSILNRKYPPLLRLAVRLHMEGVDEEDFVSTRKHETLRVAMDTGDRVELQNRLRDIRHGIVKMTPELRKLAKEILL